jgi:SAM-dependent methyltransferase
MDKQKIINSCVICGSNNWEVDRIASSILALPKIFSVACCLDCGQRWLNPKLTDEEIAEIYSQGYFNSPGIISSSHDGIELPPDYIKVVEGRHKKFHECLSMLKTKFPNAKNFLDVGAAAGDMVYVARKNGLKADGVEFSEFAIQQAAERFNIRLEHKSLSEIADSSYDLIHLNHVFEHFNNPRYEVGNLHRILRQGGGLYIEIPFQFHAIERLKYFLNIDRQPFSLHSIHHPFFYKPKTIKRILVEGGFNIESFSLFSKSRYRNKTFKSKLKNFLWRVF